MRNAIRMLVLSIAILALTTAAARATHTVYVPNYPTLTQLESGWNAAFVSWLTVQYGGAPAITSTTIYAGQEGQIFVVSSFTVGGVSGKILGRAFDPQDATYLGDGEYWYEIEDAGFDCKPTGGCIDCQPHEKRGNDGSYTRWCACAQYQIPNEGGGCQLIPLGSFTGSYALEPSYYSSLPVLN